MAFTKLDFTKDWSTMDTTSAKYFPTIESSEPQAREDMQLLHNETKTALNNVINKLESTTVMQSGADHIGAFPVKDGSTADSVQEILQETDGRLDVVERLVPIFGNITTVQTAMTSTDTAIPTSKAVLDALQDPELGNGDMLASAYASNGSGNKVDTAVNAEKLGNQLPAYYQPLLSFDSSPTNGSLNPVTSEGIYNAILNAVKWFGKATVFSGGGRNSTGFHTWGAPDRDDFGVCVPDTEGGTDYTKLFVPAGAKKIKITIMGDFTYGHSYGLGSTKLWVNGEATSTDVCRKTAFTIQQASSYTHYCTYQELIFTFPVGAVGTEYYQFYSTLPYPNNVGLYKTTLEVLE